jgi:hypothetical protein
MEIESMRVEYILYGASNFLSLKVKVTFILKECDLWEITEKVVPTPTNPKELVAHEKKEIKSKWVILDIVKDHLIPHLSKKNIFKEMFDDLVILFQRKCIDNLEK